MNINFTKYHGTGNDFIMIDDRDEQFDISKTELIAAMCHRRFGIGADGLILLRNLDEYDFQMVYFNSDGNQSSMCGNGGRCLVHFAHALGVFDGQCRFLAIDGEHEAEISNDGIVKLKMGNVNKLDVFDEDYVLDTGSPHYVTVVENALAEDVVLKGKEIRYSDRYKKNGINVNFISRIAQGLAVSTYERGVEDETYSCGTGVTASALVAHEINPDELSSPISIVTKGGDLKVYFSKRGSGYQDIWLEGPALAVYTGEW